MTLSDKEIDIFPHLYYRFQDVKTFIMELKERLKKSKALTDNNNRPSKLWNALIEQHLDNIDELAGSKLI